MATRKLTLATVCLAAVLVVSNCVQPNEEEYVLYKLLQDALVNQNTSGVSNLYILAENFFPAQQQPPICVPVTYILFCNATNPSCLESDIQNQNTSFLWTQYDLSLPIGALLLSYASSGIILKGFDWEDACIYSKPFQLNVILTTPDQFNDSLVTNVLLEITSHLKAYAQAQAVPKVGDSNNGYAIQWNEEDINEKVFANSRILLTVEVAILNIFIYFLSIGMTTYSYDTLYQNVKGKKNPGYPLFWGVVAFTLCWNVAPSWLVLARYGFQTRYSLAVMIPLQFLVALLVKKKSHFPVPLMSPRSCVLHKNYRFTWDRAVLRCVRCLISHSMQVVAIWSILVFLTFLIYYLSAIIIAFYLSPALTLIKAIFLKGILVCAILNFALMFSVSQFKFKLTMNACKKNLASAVSLIAVIMFLPILAFLAFVIGGILFSPQNQPSALQSIITLIPTAFLLIVAWTSKGQLFPEGLHDTDPAKEIASDLEKGALSHHKDKPPGPSPSGGGTHPTTAPKKVSQDHDPPPAGVPLSNYGSVNDRKPADIDLHVRVSESEEKPLI